jgi:hypothetical protein
MEEEDKDKRDAAIRKAMDDDTNPKEATDEEKEKEAQIASIIDDKKQDYIKQILTANKLINPQGLKAVEERVKSASISDLKKELEIVKPFIATTTTETKPESFVGYYANITPQDTDNETLTASSPDSEFNKFTTKELLEMSQ